MRVFTFSIVLFFLSNLAAQKVSKSDPTYMNVDHDRIKYYVQKELKDFGGIYFMGDTIPSNAKMTNLQLIHAPKIEGIGKINKLNLFQLDTNSANFKNVWRFYQNPEYLKLSYENATGIGGHTTSIGFITDKLLKEKPNWKGLVKTLIYLGVIGTYHHLYSELVIRDEASTDAYYLISFNVVWHMCTNECVDPKYKFSVKIDKETGEVSLIGK